MVTEGYVNGFGDGLKALLKNVEIAEEGVTVDDVVDEAIEEATEGMDIQTENTTSGQSANYAARGGGSARVSTGEDLSDWENRAGKLIERD